MNTLRFANQRLVASLICLAMGGWATYSSALQAQQSKQPTAPAAGNQHDKLFDAHVASCLILGNQNEIAAARIAEEKAESDNVRAFAKEMIDAHQKCIDSLERFAHNHHRDRASREPGASRKRGAAAAATVAAEPEPAKASPGADEPRGATTAQAGEHHEHFSKYMKIREELADQCRASVKRELDTTDGREFDECFMGLQVGYHMLLVDELTVLIRHGSPELKPVLQQDLVQAQKHFDKAKQILMGLRGERAVSATSTETE